MGPYACGASMLVGPQGKCPLGPSVKIALSSSSSSNSRSSGSFRSHKSGGYKRVRAVRPESVAGAGWFEVLWNLECPVG